MNGLRPCKDCGADNLAFIQIALRSLWASNAVALVGERHMEVVLIRFGIYRHRGHSHLLAGADDAHGNLAAVGNQDF